MNAIRKFLIQAEDKFWKNRRNGLKPSIFQHDYLHHFGMVKNLKEKIPYMYSQMKKSRLNVVDIGCGEKPYLKLFAPYTNKYIGVDMDAQGADITAKAEKLPFRKSTFDIAVCFQVLEHIYEPEKAISEMKRIVKRGGFVILTTHGSWMYHPSPHDYYRWTNEGLTLLFKDFSRVSVKPILKAPVSLLQLTIIELYSISCRRFFWKLPSYGVIMFLNLLGRLIWNQGQEHFTTNYFVLARK